MQAPSTPEPLAPLGPGDRLTLASRVDPSIYVPADVTFVGGDVAGVRLGSPAPWLSIGGLCVGRRFGPDGVDSFLTAAVRPVATVNGRSRTEIVLPDLIHRVQRRREPRLQLTVPMAWSTLGVDLRIDAQVDGHALDLSTGGVRFHTPRCPGVGELVVCALYLPQGAAIVAGAVLDVVAADRHLGSIAPARVDDLVVDDDRDDALGWVVRVQFAHVDHLNRLRIVRTVHAGLGLEVPTAVATGRHPADATTRWNVYLAHDDTARA